jgi:hypothetical protein|tara:strand:- start:472 stop:687 length:216 start_codon:yes stop_codon:yes gene_type:complete
MDRTFKGIAIVFAIALAMVTGSLYIKGVRDHVHQIDDLNIKQRMKQLCADALKADWSEEDRAEFLKRNCQG